MEKTLEEKEYRIQALIEMLLVSKTSLNNIISQFNRDIFIDRAFINFIKLMIEEKLCNKDNKNKFIDIIALFKEDLIKHNIITLQEYNQILRKILTTEIDNMEEYLKEEKRLHINAITLYKRFNEDIKNFIVKDFYVVNYLFEPTEENIKKIEHPVYFSGTIDKILLSYPQFLYNKDVIKNICNYIEKEDAIILKDRKRLMKIVKEIKKQKFFVATNDYGNYKMCMAYLMNVNIYKNIEKKLINDSATIDSLYRISIIAKEYNCFEEFFILRAINLCNKFKDEKIVEIINNFKTSKSTNSYDFYLNEYLIKTNKKTRKLTEEKINEIRNSILYEYLLVDLIEEEDYILSLKKFNDNFIGNEIFFASLIKIAHENNEFIIVHRKKIKNLLSINMEYIKNDSYRKKLINKRLLKSL